MPLNVIKKCHFGSFHVSCEHGKTYLVSIMQQLDFRHFVKQFLLCGETEEVSSRSPCKINEEN